MGVQVLQKLKLQERLIEGKLKIKNVLFRLESYPHPHKFPVSILVAVEYIPEH